MKTRFKKRCWARKRWSAGNGEKRFTACKGYTGKSRKKPKGWKKAALARIKAISRAYWQTQA